MMEHALFPTLVCEFQYDQQMEFKQIFYQNIFNHMTESGHSDESTGHVYLHHDDNFARFFQFATDCVKQYVARLHIDTEVFDFNMIKTWMNITRDRSTPLHNHADAHLSFTYYINIPDSFYKALRFHNHERRFEPFPGSIRFNDPAAWDQFNAYTWDFIPKEGNLFVFPAALRHETIGNDDAYIESGAKTVEELEQKRICLAGDILLTYKDRAAKPMGIQPISNWRRFS